MRVTMADVARKANVSHCTVSRVLNNKYRHKYTEATRQRVLQAADELSYRPNILARGLRKQASTFVGVLLPDLVNSFIPNLVQGIQDVCDSKDLSTVVYSTRLRPERLEKYVQLLIDKRVEGMIIYDPFHQLQERTLRRLQQHDIPVIAVLVDLCDGATTSIKIDQALGARLATEHLLSLGHRSILHLSAENADSHGRERYEGFLKAVQDYPHHIGTTMIEVDWSWDKAYEEISVLYGNARTDAPTAIFASSDATALGAIKALLEHGYRIPDDVSVVGFDDLPYAEMSYPGLTTIAQPKYPVGEHAMSLLLRMMHGQPVSPVLLEPQLILRQSTAAPPEQPLAKGHSAAT